MYSKSVEISKSSHIQQPLLYGFSTLAERDLFRQLISVTGIGAANAIALLDTLPVPDLISAIVTSNSNPPTKVVTVSTKGAASYLGRLAKTLTMAL